MKLAIVSFSSLLLLVSACGNGDQDVAAAGDAAVTTQQGTSVPDKSVTRTSKRGSPVQIDYRVIGTPIVGQPVSVDLQLRSTLGPQPYRVSIRVNDPTAMQLPEAQSAMMSISPSANAEFTSQQVTVVPMREGRLYLNVAAIIETETGSTQTVTAIPIQVGAKAPREFVENGTVTTDEDGNLIRVLPATED